MLSSLLMLLFPLPSFCSVSLVLVAQAPPSYVEPLATKWLLGNSGQSLESCDIHRLFCIFVQAFTPNWKSVACAFVAVITGEAISVLVTGILTLRYSNLFLFILCINICDTAHVQGVLSFVV